MKHRDRVLRYLTNIFEDVDISAENVLANLESAYGMTISDDSVRRDELIYKIRCWNQDKQKVYVQDCTYTDLIYGAAEMQMNMIDVGLTLLNLEREKRGLSQIPSEAISSNDLVELGDQHD